jgi:hypothetical protein
VTISRYCLQTKTFGGQEGARVRDLVELCNPQDDDVGPTVVHTAAGETGARGPSDESVGGGSKQHTRAARAALPVFLHARRMVVRLKVTRMLAEGGEGGCVIWFIHLFGFGPACV